MSWLRSVFGSDGSPVIQYLVIFAIIFSALAAIVFVVRRLTRTGGALQGRGGRVRQPRLGIVDVYELDRARQLILLRRDNVEHLLLVGGPNDVVIERNIQRGQRPLPEATLRAEPAAEPLPDPLAEAGRLPEPPRAITEQTGRPIVDPSPRRTEPAFEMPIVVPPPVPGSSAPPPVRLPLDAALIDGDEPGRDIPVPPPSPAPTPAPILPTPPASVREALLRPRPPRGAAPALDRQPETEPPAEPIRLPDASFAMPPLTAPPVTPPPLTPPPVAPSLTPPPADPRPVDPAILSDMAKQLQAAIARPSSAAAPPPATPVPPPPAPVVPPPPPPAPPQVDPIAAAMAALVSPPRDPIASGMSEKSEPTPRPEPLPARPSRAEKKAAPRTEPAAAKPEPKSAGNPFSVEEIEAEFARLLGRPLDKRH